VHAVPVTEQILSFMFAFARNLHLNIRAQARHEWRKESMAQVSELSGKRALVIGVGAIGSHFARAAACLGMRVTGIRRHPEKDGSGVDEVFGLGELHRELGRADYVVVILPATPETRGMFAAPEFEAMKNGAVFINAGRGSLVDEKALVSALRSGRIGGAGLDVFETEPLPSDSPLWDMENVIIAPHTAGYTPEYVGRSFEIFLDNFPRYRAGEPLHNRVDKAAGY
jgi:phosphoglycerate dehydrogenase-like enzyme